MVAASDAIRQDIEETRDRLSREIDELADRTLPHRIVKRRWRGRHGKSEPEAVSAADDAEAAELPGSDEIGIDSVLDPEPNDVADEVKRSVRGRLIIAGIAAVGVGVVIAWLIPRRSGDE